MPPKVPGHRHEQITKDLDCAFVKNPLVFVFLIAPPPRPHGPYQIYTSSATTSVAPEQKCSDCAASEEPVTTSGDFSESLSQKPGEGTRRPLEEQSGVVTKSPSLTDIDAAPADTPIKRVTSKGRVNESPRTKQQVCSLYTFRYHSCFRCNCMGATQVSH